MNENIRRFVVAAALLCMGACASSSQNASVSDTGAASNIDRADINRDRQAILAMSGNYNVTFDFRETVALQKGYQPKDAYVTHAQEIVRVIEDRGDFISLQHILLVGGEQKIPIKHWRQDWAFEPANITRFIGGNGWENVSLSNEEVDGKWAQFVYQVDDGPRYAGLGEWRYGSGFAEWASAPSWRPLPRRDATKRSDYHTIEAVNRHAITPGGWVHEQDNTKLVLDGTSAQALVREVGVNTYVKADNIDAASAMTYWNKTSDFWRNVRTEWTNLETNTAEFGLTVQGEPEEVYMQILGVATSLAEGEVTTEQASNDARAIIRDYTATDLKPLRVRLSEVPKTAPVGD